jgi:hypothetical protein
LFYEDLFFTSDKFLAKACNIQRFWFVCSNVHANLFANLFIATFKGNKNANFTQSISNGAVNVRINLASAGINNLATAKIDILTDLSNRLSNSINS